jgi:hypothetical protein
MTIPNLVTGDDFALPINLTVNDIAYAVSTGATVTAGIVTGDHATLLLSGVVQSSATTGANWPSGTVVVVFTGADTSAITQTGLALIELQVAGTSKDTWFTPVNVVKGHLA